MKTLLGRILFLTAFCSVFSLGCCSCGYSPAGEVKNVKKAGCDTDKCDCGCKAGKDCRCAEIEAASLITCPCHTEDSLPEDLPAKTQREVERLCYDWALWNSAEPWAWTKETTRNWLIWARTRYEQEYWNAAKFPELGDAGRLPSHVFATSQVKTFADAKKWHTDVWFSNWTDDAWVMFDALAENVHYWSLLRDAADPQKPDIFRRKCLHEIRNTVGDLIFFSGQWNLYPPLTNIPRTR